MNLLKEGLGVALKIVDFLLLKIVPRALDYLTDD